MGGSHSSTRSLSIDNDFKEAATVIKVSEKVVDRLKAGCTDDEEEQVLDQQAQVSKPRFTDGSNSTNLNIFEDGIPFVTARMIRQELENELQKNNKYWERRIARLQDSHEKVNCIMEQEYIKAIEALRKELPVVPPEKSSFPCQDKKAEILRCYKSHPKRPLLCSQEVEAFTCCMTNTRVKLQNDGKLGY